MKKNSLLILTLSLCLFTSCTKRNNQSESSSQSFKDCDFKVLVFSSYDNEKGGVTFDFEEFEEWTPEGTHDYAIAKNDKVKTAYLEILKTGKVHKKIDFVLEPAGVKITHLNDKGKVVEHIRSMGESLSNTSLRFIFNMKSKLSCKKDIEVLIE